MIAAHRWSRDDQHPSGRQSGVAFLNALREGPPWPPHDTARTYVGRPWRGRHLRAFFACMYFAALRPAEVKALRKDGCYLLSPGGASSSCPGCDRSQTSAGPTAEKHSMTGARSTARETTRLSVPIPPSWL